MKNLITLFILVFSLSLIANDKLVEELNIKSKNFETVKVMYENLKHFAINEDRHEFCNLVVQSQIALKDIYQDDYNLNQELIRDAQDFSVDYAKKVHDNSLTDLFVVNIYKEFCDSNQAITLSRYVIYLDRSIQNNHLLSLSHELFIQIFQGLNSL